MSRPPAPGRILRHLGRPVGRDRGAAAVEFALVVPILLTLFFGIAEFGRAYDTQAALSQAARQGARTLALGGDEAAGRSAAQQAADDLGLTAAVITVPTICTGAGARATVEVRQRQVFLTGLFDSAITLTGTGVMKCTG